MIRKAKALKGREGYYNLYEIITVEDYNGNGTPRFIGKDVLGYPINCLVPRSNIEYIDEDKEETQ